MKLHRLLIVAITVLGIGIAIAPAPAQAYSGCAANTACGWLYYADAAHTLLQGGHTTNCDGVVSDWGIKAGYSVFVSQSCGGPLY